MGNNAGELKRNFSENTVIALAWGVFPNREIQQPTVLDSESFLAWKDEAFAVMVNDWAGIYDQESQSKQVLQEIHDDYYLVNIVDNDFISENFREMFREVFESLQSSQ